MDEANRAPSAPTVVRLVLSLDWVQSNVYNAPELLSEHYKSLAEAADTEAAALRAVPTAAAAITGEDGDGAAAAGAAGAVKDEEDEQQQQQMNEATTGSKQGDFLRSLAAKWAKPERKGKGKAARKDGGSGKNAAGKEEEDDGDEDAGEDDDDWYDSDDSFIDDSEEVFVRAPTVVEAAEDPVSEYFVHFGTDFDDGDFKDAPAARRRARPRGGDVDKSSEARKRVRKPKEDGGSTKSGSDTAAVVKRKRVKAEPGAAPITTAPGTQEDHDATNTTEAAPSKPKKRRTIKHEPMDSYPTLPLLESATDAVKRAFSRAGQTIHATDIGSLELESALADFGTAAMQAQPEERLNRQHVSHLRFLQLPEVVVRRRVLRAVVARTEEQRAQALAQLREEVQRYAADLHRERKFPRPPTTTAPAAPPPTVLAPVMTLPTLPPSADASQPPSEAPAVPSAPALPTAPWSPKFDEFFFQLAVIRKLSMDARKLLKEAGDRSVPKVNDIAEIRKLNLDVKTVIAEVFQSEFDMEVNAPDVSKRYRVICQAKGSFPLEMPTRAKRTETALTQPTIDAPQETMTSPPPLDASSAPNSSQATPLPASQEMSQPAMTVDTRLSSSDDFKPSIRAPPPSKKRKAVIPDLPLAPDLTVQPTSAV